MIVRIKASRPVYRRLGVVFGKQLQDFAEDRFTSEELERLKADPVLTVILEDGERAATDTDGPSGDSGLSGGDTSENQPAEPPARPAKTRTKPAAKSKAGAQTKAKAPAKTKVGAKAAAKPAAEAPKDQPPTGDDANSSAKAAEGDGTGAGQE